MVNKFGSVGNFFGVFFDEWAVVYPGCVYTGAAV